MVEFRIRMFEVRMSHVKILGCIIEMDRWEPFRTLTPLPVVTPTGVFLAVPSRTENLLVYRMTGPSGFGLPPMIRLSVSRRNLLSNFHYPKFLPLQSGKSVYRYRTYTRIDSEPAKKIPSRDSINRHHLTQRYIFATIDTNYNANCTI